MRIPKVTIKKGAQAEIESSMPSLRDRGVIERYLAEVIRMSEKIMDKAVGELEEIWSKSSTDAKKRAWNNLAAAVDYLGSSKLNKKQIKGTLRRMKRISKRIKNKQLKITLKSQRDASKNTTRATNNGALLSPNKFMIYSRAFNNDIEELALTIIHELFHDLHIDHKVRDKGEKVTVYGSKLAKKLAKKHPKKARRNPENLEQFCRAIWHQDDILV